MKGSLRYKVCLWMVWVLFAFMPMASFGEQPQAKDIQKPPLWIVDGYALRDSVFQYSITEMKSDSAAYLVSHSLLYVVMSDIKSISCSEDSAPAVNILIGKQIPILVVVNGVPQESKAVVSLGRVLTGNDWIQEIVASELPHIEDCGIKNTIVLREKELNSFCELPRGPILIITTRKPYNKVKAVLEHMMPNPNIRPHKEKGGKQ